MPACCHCVALDVGVQLLGLGFAALGVLTCAGQTNNGLVLMAAFGKQGALPYANALVGVLNFGGGTSGFYGARKAQVRPLRWFLYAQIFLLLWRSLALGTMMVL